MASQSLLYHHLHEQIAHRIHFVVNCCVLSRLQVAPGKGRGRGKGGKEDQSAILMASLFGEEEEEERPQRRCV